MQCVVMARLTPLMIHMPSAKKIKKEDKPEDKNPALTPYQQQVTPQAQGGPSAPATRDTPEAIANLNRGFDALASEQNMVAAPKESNSDKVMRGVSGLLGFVPKGGTRGDAADGFANIGRSLMGLNSVQQMESDYNQSVAPEKLRRALETGDAEEIARLDIGEGTARQRFDGNQAKAAAAESPEVAKARSRKVELANAAEAMSRETGVPYGDAVGYINQQLGGGVFDDMELTAARDGGYDGLKAIIGDPVTSADRFLLTGGNTAIDLRNSNMDKIDWQSKPKTPEEMEMFKADLAYKVSRGNLTDAQALKALRDAESNALRAAKYQPGGGADSASGFGSAGVVVGSLTRAYNSIEAANEAGVFVDPEAGGGISTALTAMKADPNIVDSSKWRLAMSVLDPKGFEAVMSMRQSQRDLMQAIRQLPGMEASKLADTPAEQEMLRQTALQYDGSYGGAKRSLGATTGLFAQEIEQFVLNNPNASPQAKEAARDILRRAGIGGYEQAAQPNQAGGKYPEGTKVTNKDTGEEFVSVVISGCQHNEPR